MSKVIKAKDSQVYIGPSRRGLRHGTVLRDREAVLRVKTQIPERAFDELVIPIEDWPEAEQQIQKKKGSHYIAYKQEGDK